MSVTAVIHKHSVAALLFYTKGFLSNPHDRRVTILTIPHERIFLGIGREQPQVLRVGVAIVEQTHLRADKERVPEHVDQPPPGTL